LQTAKKRDRRGRRLPDRLSRGRTRSAAWRGRHTKAATRYRGIGGAHAHPYGQPLNPREAERKGLVHKTVSGKALDRAIEIAKRFCSFTPESLGYIKRLVRNATDTPLAQGLALERNLFMRLCASDQGLVRMRSYEEKKITEPSRSIEV
jgi:enoyl-CoA hydratase/carnithine racemase